jgi:hypothetical protein
VWAIERALAFASRRPFLLSRSAPTTWELGSSVTSRSVGVCDGSFSMIAGGGALAKIARTANTCAHP